MKKNIFLMTLLMTILSVFIPIKVNAYSITLPTETQYRDILNQVGGYRRFGQACFYNNYPNEHVICYFGGTNFNMWANQSDNLINRYNVYGAYFNSWFWDANNNEQYLSDAIATWNGTAWTINCLGNGHTCSNIDQPNISSTTEYFLTWYYQSTYFTNYDFIKTPYIYDNQSQTLSSMEQYTSVYLLNPSYTPVSLNITEYSTGDYSKGLLIQLDNSLNYPNINVMYSYNDLEYYSLNISSNNQVANLPVYTNGVVYFKIIDENNSVLYTTTYNVTGMQSISGYDLYEIPKGNNQVYISNLGNNTTGSFYIPPGQEFTDTFYFLDNNGQVLGQQVLNYLSYNELGGTGSFGGSTGGGVRGEITMVKIDYDFTNYSNTKVISFNYNKDSNLLIYVPTGVYLYYTQLTNNASYECNSDSNLSNSIDYNNCFPKYEIKENGQTIQKVDYSYNTYNNITDDFYSTSTNILNSTTGYLVGITTMLTNFMIRLDPSIQYTIYTCIIFLVIYVIVKLFKH